MIEAAVRVTIRYPSGEVEHRYGTDVPQIGERIGRNGDGGFVTSVEEENEGHWTVRVGTAAPPGVTWSDASAPRVPGRASSARERILETAYDLFSKRGIRAVGTEELIDQAGVSRATFYRHFASKQDLVLAFLQRREHRWTREFVEAEARRRGATPRERLLAIFDVFDEWFHRDDFEGCSFINVLLETASLEDPVGRASADHLEYIRSVVRTLAEEAGIEDAAGFAHSWHILMKGSIVAAGEGDVEAAKRARAMGELVLDHYLTETRVAEVA
jgi:AcrR family transcriptional regulator